MGAFYEAFPPEKAREYVRRIKFVYTPKHGSWLNVAECELSCLTSQCLSDRRIADILTLQAEIAAWAIRVNTTPSNGLSTGNSPSRKPEAS